MLTKVREQVFSRKKIAGAVSLVLMAALLIGATFAWVDNHQHRLNPTRGGEFVDVTLNDNFNPPDRWGMGNALQTKQVSVTNPERSADGVETTDMVFVRLQFREFFQRFVMAPVFYAPDVPFLFAAHATGGAGVIGHFMTYAEATVQGLNYLPVRVLRNTTTGAITWDRDTNADPAAAPAGTELVGVFAQTQNAEIRNGIYGKIMYVGQGNEIFYDASQGTPPVMQPIDWAGTTNVPHVGGTHCHEGNQLACLYHVYRWGTENITSGTANTRDYVQWNLGADVMTMQEWLAAPTPPTSVWVIDPADGWAYWVAPIMPGQTTANIMESIQLLQMPGANFDYHIHIHLEAVIASTLDTWRATASTGGNTIIDVLDSVSDFFERIVNVHGPGGLPAPYEVGEQNGFPVVVDPYGNVLICAVNFPCPVLRNVLTNGRANSVIFNFDGNNTPVPGEVTAWWTRISQPPADTNGDGRLSQTEIANFTSFHVARNEYLQGGELPPSISSLVGLELFPYLTRIEAQGNAITVFNGTRFPDLVQLQLTDTSLSNVDLSRNVNLENLTISINHNLAELDLSNNTKLQTLNSTNLAVTRLDFTGLVDLELVNAGSNVALTEVLGLNTTGNLRRLALQSTSIAGHFDATAFTQLNELHLANTPNITSVDVSGLTLDELRLERSSGSPTSLDWVDITGTTFTDITEFRFQNNGNIEIIGAAGRTFTHASRHLAGNNITIID